MKRAIAILIFSGALQSPALIIEADAPTKFTDGTAITPELSGFLRGTLYMKPSSSSKWTKIGTTPGSAFRWTVAAPAPGLWQFAVTAQFLDLTNTVSAVSETLSFEVTDGPASGGPSVPDSDGDHMADAHELIAGTLPEDPASVLSLACTILPDGRRRLSWFGVKSRGYTVQYCDSMSGDWQSHPFEFTGADSALSFTDSAPAGMRFYRLNVRLTGE